MRNRFLALTLVGTLASLVSCGTTTASSERLNSTRTSVYDTTVNRDNARYVPSTYSANRVKYYDGLATDTYNYGQNYMYDYGTYNGKYNSAYNGTYDYKDNGTYNDYTTNKLKTSAYDTYRDRRGTTSSNYMTNPYMYSSDYYRNDTYKDLSTTDFNNGLVTYEHNADTANRNTKRLTTNALNATTSADSAIKSDTTMNRKNYVDMNEVNYDMGNTYDEVKDATKELVNDVSKDAKKMVRDAKKDIKTATNKMTY